MNKQMVSNPVVEVPKGIDMNDRDYITDVLMSLKAMVKNYTVALTEASNESLCNKYLEMFDQFLDLQRDTFEVMFRKGWYFLEKTDKKKINSKYDILSKKLEDLSL